MPGTPSYGQIYNDGVKYIKINRYDSGGLDRSNYLSQLQSITLTYPDRSAIDYPIVTIQEQANFYLYGITPGYNTSSKGEILNYSLDVQKGSTVVTSGNREYITNYGTITTNPLGYFTASAGTYYFHKTPNVGINYSWSAEIKTSVGGTAGVDSVIVLAQSGSRTGGGKTLYDFTGLTSTVYIPISGSGILTPNIIFGESYSPIENSYYIATIYNSDNTGTGDVTLRNFNLQFITSSSPFVGSSSLVLFAPGTINFDYNDYNPLLNNVDIPQYSTVWMDVDYSQNPLVPVNFDLIIAGIADRAFVQDSNYSSKAWSNIRYNGSKTTSYRIN